MDASETRRAVRTARERVTALRAELAAAAVDDQRVWSVDGATFRFDVVTDEPIRVGAYVRLELVDGAVLLGAVTAVRPGERPGPTVRLDDIGMGSAASAEVQVPIRSVRGAGTVLGSVTGDGALVAAPRTAFDAATLAPASDELVAAATVRTGDGALRFGTVLGRDVPIDLDARGFGRHTFVCGQSGSGKTYAIGKVLEQLLLETTLPIVALDPNSDYVTLTAPRPRAETGLDEQAYAERCARLAELAPSVPVFGSDDDRLAVLFGRLRTEQQAMVLGLDPVADATAYAVLRHAAQLAGPDATMAGFLDVAATLDGGDALVGRARNRGVDTWGVWATTGERVVRDRLGEGWRAAVFDLGTCRSAAERSLVAAAVLGALWESRYDRVPRLVLIDEAHNVCPAAPTSPVQAAAADVVRSIAAEGRKFGLYLLLATQEPHKLHPDVLSQCANLLLMRTTNAAALGVLGEVFSDLSADLLAVAATLQLGEGILAGRVAPHPTLTRTGDRLTRDGGRDVPADWVRSGA